MNKLLSIYYSIKYKITQKEKKKILEKRIKQALK